VASVEFTIPTQRAIITFHLGNPDGIILEMTGIVCLYLGKINLILAGDFAI
jgi:hypothetical protein